MTPWTGVMITALTCALIGYVTGGLQVAGVAAGAFLLIVALLTWRF